MRTTVEIPDAQRAKLLELAAKRGEKGFSQLIQEALERFLRDHQRQEEIDKALAQRGSLSCDEGESLEENVRLLRQRWR